MQDRLQKLISKAGFCSRRDAERMIAEGRVSVNGRVVTALGTQADPSEDTITVDGAPLPTRKEHRLIAFHKPRHVMVTRRDPEGRPTIYDYLPPDLHHLNPIGRLDFDSEGLLLLTNDGDLANRLMHPRYHLRKVYHVQISPPPRPAQLAGLMSGASAYHPIELTPLRKTPAKAVVEMVLHEGKNRQIREMCKAVGLRILELKRVAIGDITLGSLPKGRYVEIDPPHL